MDSATHQAGRRDGLSTLRQFAKTPRREAAVELCEFCSTRLAERHQHLLEVERRRVICSCDACAILFEGHARQRFRRIPRDVERLHEFALDDQEWDSLLIPIQLAFFVHSSAERRMQAYYPSPGGVMQSLLELSYWEVIATRNPILQRLQPDVEALLVNRISTPAQYFRAPIDACFQLAGLIRMHWRGLSGGEVAWLEVDRFFVELNERAGK